MVFLDFEVFRYDWLVVLIEPDRGLKTVIVNDADRLTKFYEDRKKDIYVGYNIKNYDQFIFAGIMTGFNPKQINDYIIVEGNSGYSFSKVLNKVPMIIYDVMPADAKSLKQLEGFLGNSIEESKINFNIDRKLTDAEIAETIKYCTHDVEQTIAVFIETINEFNSAMGLIKMFPESLSMYDLKLTKAQMSAKILECEKKRRNDEFDIYVLPCIELGKYAAAKEFFLNPENHWYKKGTTENNFKLMVAGLEHTLAWGGIHAGKKQYHLCDSNRLILHVDVASFYPRLMIFHGLLTRNCRKPEKFKRIFEKRLELKHAGKKKEQAPLKIVINGTYGISKDKRSKAYDPRNANLVCINGQLMLIDLIAHLEVVPGFELIQSNTDGLIISIPNTDAAFNAVDDVCYEWETRCNMELEFDEISEIYEKDVNNYVFRYADGKLERKGAYTKEKSVIDNNLPIITQALVDYMMEGIPVEQTVNECDDMQMFQMVKKITSKFEHLYHGEILNERCVRVYASQSSADLGLQWKSARTGKYGKVTDTPEHCFIVNGDVKGMRCPAKLDKQWYIELAKKRIRAFGVDV